ncbi:hypothetical protein [Acinetobacter baumannii]|uniref:hypothetical protein n=1 Tax=Acinetobacter baumannii TaxID=470 RepID=UPI00114E4329|nr:hypothetical protein [Acinetobacter baumannii]MCJ9562806.1 hypothetical protein [Acinetobacter baumannii]MDP7923960.1 hypothetical protein [Acinetobacter baumannii]TQF23824.1 hypothetical protein FJU44_10205 [Acinetobacter baumannii]
MKTKAHLIGLIAKKCAALQIEKQIDAFCNLSTPFQLLEVEIYRNWNKDSNDKLYQASISTDGRWNGRSDASNFAQVLEDLDAIYLGLGVE